jgi:hypothetical protein
MCAVRVQGVQHVGGDVPALVHKNTRTMSNRNDHQNTPLGDPEGKQHHEPGFSAIETAYSLTRIHLPGTVATMIQ